MNGVMITKTLVAEEPSTLKLPHHTQAPVHVLYFLPKRAMASQAAAAYCCNPEHLSNPEDLMCPTPGLLICTKHDNTRTDVNSIPLHMRGVELERTSCCVSKAGRRLCTLVEGTPRTKRVAQVLVAERGGKVHVDRPVLMRKGGANLHSARIVSKVWEKCHVGVYVSVWLSSVQMAACAL
eukprot:1161319-Pelagomonas_calceolata.AAC.15